MTVRKNETKGGGTRQPPKKLGSPKSSSQKKRSTTETNTKDVLFLSTMMLVAANQISTRGSAEITKEGVQIIYNTLSDIYKGIK